MRTYCLSKRAVVSHSSSENSGSYLSLEDEVCNCLQDCLMCTCVTGELTESNTDFSQGHCWAAKILVPAESSSIPKHTFSSQPQIPITHGPASCPLAPEFPVQEMLSRMTPFAFILPARSCKSAKVVWAPEPRDDDVGCIQETRHGDNQCSGFMVHKQLLSN